MDEVTPKPERIRQALNKLISAVRPKVESLTGGRDEVEFRLPIGMAVDHRLLCILMEIKLENLRKTKHDLETLNELMPIIMPEVKAHRALESIMRVIDSDEVSADTDDALAKVRAIAAKALNKP